MHKVKEMNLSGRILVVDDDALVRFLVAEWLRDQGYSVVEASSAMDALGKLVSNANVNLVVTDVHMPGPLNGFDLSRRIRAGRPFIPVVVMSGEAAEQEAIDASASAFIRKPLDFDRFGNIVSSLMYKGLPAAPKIRSPHP